MHHHAPIPAAQPHLSLNAAQLFNALRKVERVDTQFKANGDMVSADSVHKLVKVAIANQDKLRSAAVQVATLLNQLEKRRVYEEFLVLIGFGSGGSNQVRSLLAMQLPIPQYGNVSNRRRYSKYLGDDDFSFSHGRAFSFIWVRFIVAAEHKPHQVSNDSGERPSPPGAQAIEVRSGLGEHPPPRSERMTSVQRDSSASYPVLCSGSRFGPIRRPAAGSLFCFDFVALRVTVSSFAGPSANAELRPWEPGPLAGSAMCDPSRIREINETEITTMYQNKVTLIGFLGNDAEVRTNDNRSFTTLSLATKSSYKKDGKYISHTEWHRCVVFGKLSEFAGTLKKGAHLQVEGELRSREYETKKVGKKPAQKKTIWEIRVNSILKLDRAEKAGSDEQEVVDQTPEEAAA